MPDREEPTPWETSPFPPAETRSRLESFLSAYGSIDGTGPFRPTDLLPVAADRLRRLAEWTDGHAQRNGIAALMENAKMYRAHADRLAGGSSSLS